MRGTYSVRPDLAGSSESSDEDEREFDSHEIIISNWEYTDQALASLS